MQADMVRAPWYSRSSNARSQRERGVLASVQTGMLNKASISSAVQCMRASLDRSILHRSNAALHLS